MWRLWSWCAVSAVLGLSLAGAAQVREDPEVYMDVRQLVTSKGYPFEDHEAHTRDGYILGLHRIPHGKNGTKGGGPVVFLQHGLLSCSACWVENLANESLGFILADAGYDVWMGNSRGSTYSMRHERLSPKQREFWQFTWDEMALEDLPASISKVLQVSGAAKLVYVGHSQGGTIAMAGFSAVPGLQDKVKLIVPLAPAVYMANTRSPIRLLAPFAWEFEWICELLGTGELLPKSKLITWFASVACGDIPSDLCENFLFLLAGYDEAQMNKTRIPVYVGQHPAGTSALNVVHFAQMINTKEFRMFDYGRVENMRKYNQTTPPTYTPSKITVPVALFSGTNDWLVNYEGVQKLSKELPKLALNAVVAGWEHLDFVWAMDAPSVCYDPIMKLIQKYTHN